MQDGTAKIVARWTALGALFLIPLTPLLVANSFFFPFITGKAFYFRILVEIAVAAWVALAFLDRQYRPRFSWIGAAAVAFVGWMFIADSFALNAVKAFWSNFERMEGWILLIHLLGFFFAAGAVLRVEKKWRTWFLASLSVSLIVAGYALLQLSGSLAIHQGSTRIDATLGNSAYLAIYFLFNVCIALWLALTEKQVWMKWSLIALAVLEIVLIFFTETRGTVIGLIVAGVIAAFLAALTSGKRARMLAAAALIVLIALTGGVYLARDSAFIQNNSTLQRVTSISAADGQTRFTLWRMAFEGVLARPIVGWGQEGYNYVFNKYYDASLYTQESWFDRAHNTFIDWLVAGGFPAFFLYLALFGSVIALLWKHSSLSRPERIALTAALAGYAVHNTFVFDNLYSYVYFFAILAVVDSQVSRPFPRFEKAPEASAADGASYILPVTAVALAVVIWTVNIPGMRVAGNLITALSSSDFTTSIAAFQDLAAHPSFAAQEVREQLVNFASSVSQSSQLTNEQKQQAATLAITEMQKQIASYPFDAREHLELAYAYRASGDYKDALKEMQVAQTLSPQKIDTLILEGATAWDMGDAKSADSYFAAAYALAPERQNLAEYAAAGQIAIGDAAAADAILMNAFGTTSVDSDTLAMAYYRAKDWPRLIMIWKKRAAQPNASAQTLFSLAAAYYASGDDASAISTLKAAAALHPDAASSVQAAIQQITGAASGK
ncbi:O-antigen ligase family protein [Patescibacteria group bacterium]|nr:O-antigen ligase family protein [Patescibacteria group bacterium]